MWAGLRRRLLLFLGAGALLFLGFSIYADIGGLLDAFGSFAWKMVPIALGFALLNYFLRFLRWHGYLRILEIPLEWNDSLIIFMTGLVLSVTPGKVGEFLKTYLVRRCVGTPVSRSAPAVFMERVTDFISLILLAFLGILSFRFGAFPLYGRGRGNRAFYPGAGSAHSRGRRSALGRTPAAGQPSGSAAGASV